MNTPTPPVDSQKVADLIVSPTWVITVDSENRILEKYSLVVREGKIIDICETENAVSNYKAPHQQLPGQALLPGFINAHTHSAMNLLKGYAEDLSLQNWLNDYIWPTENTWMSEDFVRDGSLLACAEMIKSGTTCFNDMYFFPHVVAQVVENCGLRACLSTPILEFSSVWADNADSYIEKGIALHDQFSKNPYIDTAFGPHAPYTVQLDTFKKISSYAEELDCNIHMHLHENAQEVADFRKEHGKSAIELYAEHDLLSPRLQAVHMTQLNENEIELIAKHKVKVVHCPESNMKLASGIAPVQKLLDKGVQVALGTDSASSNNDLDMIGEMKSAALLAKASTGNAEAFNAEQCLRMATISGAEMLGIEQHSGSIEIGKSADMISVDLNGIECQPVYNVLSQIIYSASKNQVDNVWVMGKQLLRNRELCELDEQALTKTAQSWQQKIQNS